MRQLKFKKQTTQGLIDGILRVHEKYIYIKYNDTTQTKQVIAEFRKKGVSIEEGKGWLKIDLLGDNKTIKLGDWYIDLEEDDMNKVEEKLFQFYINQYNQMGFYVEVKE